MALKDLVSDLSNFKGQSQYDKLDSQIEGGVDFFDDTEGSHIGFRTKTSLESAYHQYQRAKGASIPRLNEETPETGIIAAPNAGVRTNIKMRRAYDMYGEPGNPGLSEPHSHIFSSDNILGVKLQPQFSSDFMTTPLAEYNSKYSLQDKVGAGSKTMSVPKEAFRISKTEPMNDTFQSSFSVNTMKKEYSDSSYIEDLFEFKLGTFQNVPAGINDKGKLKTKSFREVADPNNFDLFRQPFILRETGNQWGIDKVETDNPIGALVGGTVNIADNIIGGFFRGAPTFTGLLSRSITDKFRIGKFLLTTQGLGFLGKQFVLQGLNPTIESKVYNPLSALSISGANTLIDAVNSAAQGDSPIELGRAIGQAVVSAFIPIGHPDRHLGGMKYEDLITGPGGSRLINQSKSFRIEIPEINVPSFNTGISFIDNNANRVVNNAVRDIDVGLLTPMFTLSNPNKYLFIISSAPKSVVNGVPSFVGGIDLAAQDVRKAVEKPGGTFNPETSFTPPSENESIKRYRSKPYEKLTHRHSYFDIKNNDGNKFHMYGRSDNHEFEQEDLHDQKGTDYRNAALKVGDPGKVGKAGTMGDIVSVELLGDRGPDVTLKGDSNQRGETTFVFADGVDKVNTIPYGSGDYGDKGFPNLEYNSDFIKFRFRDVVNNKWIIFRAILEGITDTVSPEYGEERYIGRPDKIYTYQGVDRAISFTFSVYPKTKQEFPILLEKLNYLVGMCYPTFTKEERMVTPFMELTMGDMFLDTPGLLSSLTLTVEENTTWEIDDGLQFPHFIKAACEFKHIGKYVPDARGKHYDLPFLKADGLSDNRYGKNDLGFDNYPNRSKPIRDIIYQDLNQPEGS